MNNMQRKMVKEVVKYYVSLGNTYESTINDMIDYQQGREVSWLFAKIAEMFRDNGITIEDCLKNKDIVMSAISASKDNDKGEIETPEVWVAEAHKMLDELIPNWRDGVVWDSCCGNGKLEKGLEDVKDLFMSTVKELDVSVTSTLNPNAKVFVLDFTKELDFDDMNRFFYNKLHKDLRDAITEDKEVTVLINPPYKGKNNKSDLMVAMKQEGYDSEYTNELLYQFMYRLMRLPYIKNMNIGIFGNADMFKKSNFINDWFNEFEYLGGMCINKGDYDCGSAIDWNVTFTVWKRGNTSDAESIKFKAMRLNNNGEAEKIGYRTICSGGKSIEEWIKPENVLEEVAMPAVASDARATLTGSLGKLGVGAYGQISMGSKRLFVSTLPMNSGIDITDENMDRCLSAYAAKLCVEVYSDKIGKEVERLHIPDDTDSEEYKKWVADAIVLSMFNSTNEAWAYRYKGNNEGDSFVRGNFLFPIEYSVIKDMADSEGMNIIIDKAVKRDIEANAPANARVLSLLKAHSNYMSNAAKELLEFGTKQIIESLGGKTRRQCMFQNYTNAWDASLEQVKLVKHLWSMDKEKKMLELVSSLKDNMSRRLAEVGFVKDTEYFD